MPRTLHSLTAVPALTACFVLLLAGCSGRAPGSPWDPHAAARYLDGRASQWLHWHQASRDHGTVCVSCHTSLPYALARGELGHLLDEHTMPEPQRRLLDSVKQRAGMWAQMAPWYASQTPASRGTEAVINALILVRADAGTGILSPVTRTALEHLWEAQYTEGPSGGAWPWILFNNEPWEAQDSAYFGATLAALAIGITPPDYRQEPQVQTHSALLADYLHRRYPQQTLANRLFLLWAADAWPELLEPEPRSHLLADLAAAQHSDGGWGLASLMPDWKRRNGSAVPAGSDGYATGLVCFVLQTAGTAPSEAHLHRGLTWLQDHQNSWNGRWHTLSPNRSNGLIPTEGDHFMDDAATAFASLALIRADSLHAAKDPANSLAAVPRAPAGRR
jgi:squalene-hopene/tetraprenyl-beta-curcumene cyclase